jgi:hypothetical protein
MLELKEEHALSLYILYYWKFQDTDLFFEAGYDFDTSFIRQKFMQEAIFRHVPPRIPNMLELRDELAKVKKVEFETALGFFHTAAFEQSDENTEKFIQENLDMDNKSDEELIRVYIDTYELESNNKYKSHYEDLYNFVYAMYRTELEEKKFTSSKDKIIFILEKMSEELAEYIYTYGLQYDYKIMNAVKKKNSLHEELNIFENQFVPLFESWMGSEMDRKILGMVASAILLYYSRVKRKIDYIDEMYKMMYGYKGTKKNVLMHYIHEKYTNLGNLKMKRLSGEDGKVNRSQFLTDLFNALGFVKQCEREIFGIPFHPDIVTVNTMQKWIKSKV